MPDYFSNKAAIMTALADIVKDTQPPGITDEEVQVRESWLTGQGQPHRGVSIYDKGEQYNDGTIGTQDVGYLCGIVFAATRHTDAILPADQLQTWVERTRRRLTDQRLPVTIDNASQPSEHVCIVLPGRDLTNSRKYPNYSIREITVSVWLRELPTNPQL